MNNTTDSIFSNFRKKISEKFAPNDSALILKAYDFAEKAHKEQKRMSGEPYLLHCVETANNLLDMFPEPTVLCAGLLHDTVEDTSITIDDLRKEFPDPIPELVEGVTKISELKYQTDKDVQVETFRKMFLAMAKDIRVILIKMADRLHNMRTLEFLRQSKQEVIAKETLEIYAPLAHRLGMARIKSEFEDISMSILHPMEYKEIIAELEEKKSHWETIISEMSSSLKNLCDEYGIEAEIQGRIKHVYSIYKKMLRQNLTVKEIYDLVAMRIITESEVDCYEMLGLVHGKWTPIPHRIKDFIAMPKENLYRSLHTTVILHTKDRVEIQIRTKDMHRVAEEGIAAHWKYKEGKFKPGTGIEEKLSWLRSLREWLLSETYSSSDFLHTLKEDLFADIVYCFTPKGDIIELPKGSTPVDFAYAIHSAVGEKCTGAKANDKMVTLRYEIQNGDIIDIITNKSAHPSASWLESAKTSRARNKIRHYIRSLNFSKNVEDGKEILIHALKARSLAPSITQIQTYLKPYLSSLKVNSFDELLAGIGFGNISAQSVVNKILIELKKYEPVKKTEQVLSADTDLADEVVKSEKISGKSVKGQSVKSKSEILVDGMPNALIRMSLCCKPVHGVPIIGFVTRGRGVSIHRKNCTSLKKLLDRSIIEDERLIKAEWNDGMKRDLAKFSIRIVSFDRIGLLNDVTKILSSHRFRITDAETKVNHKKSIATLHFDILTEEPEIMNKVLDEIRFNVKGVTKAEVGQKKR